MSFASRRRVGVTVLFGLLACAALVAPACSSDGTVVPANDAAVGDTSVVVPEKDAAPPPIRGSLRVTASVPLRTGEDGTRATFTVALATRPTFPVVVPIASSNEAEIKAGASALTFTADDWDKPKTVTLVGQNDEVADGDQQVTLSLGPTSSADATQNGLRAEPVKVTNTDDDSAGVEVSPPTPSAITTEAGGEARFTVRLRSKPKADVTFALSSTRPSEGRADKTELVFTPSTWSQPQTVVVKGQNDAAADGDQAYAIALAKGQSVDATYAAIDPADVALVNQDDDVPGFFVSGATPSARTTEAGGAVTFTVRLRSMPSASVTIPIASNKPEEGAASVTELVFTPANYDQPQTVTVTGQDDFVDDGDVAYAVVLSPATSTDAGYAAADPPDVTLTNADDDTASMAVSAPAPNNRTSENGGQVTFTVVLRSQPLANVTVPLASSKPAEGTIDKAQLVFTAADWNVSQSVTMTGQLDDVVDVDQSYTANVGGTTSTDQLYAGLSASVALVNVNVDICGNGTVSAAEQCDDGNAVKCDGCESCERRRWLTVPAGGSASIPSITASLPRGNLCVEAWAKIGVIASGDGIVASSYGSRTDGAFLLRCQTGRLVFAHESGGPPLEAVVVGTNCDDGNWHHFAGCRSVVGGTVTNTVFLDGVLRATASGPSTTVGANATLVLGGTSYVTAGLVGAVDEVRISSSVRYAASFVPARRLTVDATTVALWHLDEGGGTTFADASGNGHTGTLGVGTGWAPDTGYSAATCQ
jgi:cysteine-rich repeat protein